MYWKFVMLLSDQIIITLLLNLTLSTGDNNMQLQGLHNLNLLKNVTLKSNGYCTQTKVRRSNLLCVTPIKNKTKNKAAGTNLK